MSPGQVKAARKLLNWSKPMLASLSGVPLDQISAYEKLGASIGAAGLSAVRKAFEAGGVEFCPRQPPNMRLRAIPEVRRVARRKGAAPSDQEGSPAA